MKANINGAKIAASAVAIIGNLSRNMASMANES